MCKPWLFWALLCWAGQALAQDADSSRTEELRARSTGWMTAFARRDFSVLREMYTPNAQMASAGARSVGADSIASFFKLLTTQRPDITWINRPSSIEVNVKWKVAYEFGDWVETWNTPTGSAEIQGKYFVMWRQQGANWLIDAATFTPLRCVGPSSYCR